MDGVEPTQGYIAYENVKASVKGNVTPHVEQAAAEGLEHGEMALSGLRKLPNWKGTVYRGELWTQQEFDQRYSPNGIHTVGSFTSTSKDPRAAMDFKNKDSGDKMAVVQTMQVTKGKVNSKLSFSPHEQEIMMMPGTQFAVNKIVENAPERGPQGEEIPGKLKSYDVFLTEKG